MVHLKTKVMRFGSKAVMAGTRLSPHPAGCLGPLTICQWSRPAVRDPDPPVELTKCGHSPQQPVRRKQASGRILLTCQD